MKKFLHISILLLLNMEAFAQTQSFDSIHNAIKKYIAEEFTAAKEYRYKISPLDHRLKLPACSDKLQVFSIKGTLIPGRNSLGVRCQKEKKWTVYTSVKIQAFKNILVLTRPIKRGETLGKHHLAFQKTDISQLHQGYMDDIQSVINKQAKRNLARNTILNNRLITEPALVKKGERVKIQSSNAFFQISMSGIAMMNGTLGQNIKVRNINSKKIIQATVVKPGLVSVF